MCWMGIGGGDNKTRVGSRNVGFIQVVWPGEALHFCKDGGLEVKPSVIHSSEVINGRAGVRTWDCLTPEPAVFHLSVLLLPTCWNFHGLEGSLAVSVGV